jgi:hypothetical protein
VRRLTLLALAIAVTLAAAAAALAGSKDPRLHKRPADVRRAKALVMTLHDLPAGFVDKGRQKNSSPTPDLPCSVPSLHALVMTADVGSHDFVRSRTGSYAEASSDASFFARSAQAAKAVRVMTSKKIGRCLKKVVVRSAKKSAGAAIEIVSSRLVPVSENVGDLHLTLWDLFLDFKTNGVLLRDELVMAFSRRGRVVSMLMLNSLNGLTQDEAKSISEALTVRLELLPKSVVG